MILKMYTDSLLNELKTNRKLNIPRYSEPTSFVKTLVDNYDLELYNLNKEVTYPILDYTIAKKGDMIPQWQIDYNNSVKLHKDFVLKYKIPLNILLDERFITYLTHDIYYDFNIVRWPINDKEVENSDLESLADKDKKKPSALSRIESKYFVPSGAQGFTRNLFMRFFWYAHITYMQTEADPYELTRIAFEYQDPVNQIMERKYSKNKKIVIAALKAIKEVGSKDLNRKRALFGKYINNMLSLYALDALKEDELKKLFIEQIKEIIGSDVEDDSSIEEE